MEPVPQPVVVELFRRYAALRSRLQDEIDDPPLILPNAEFFPDAFRGDEASLGRLVRRMQVHAGMDDIPIEPTLVPFDGPEPQSSCGSGACAPAPASDVIARVEETEAGWLLNVAPPELLHPTALTCNLSRALAQVFLMETCETPEQIEAPADLTTDIAAVQLGFGPLLLQGSYIYTKSCGGPSVAQLTSLGVAELAVVVMLFSAVGEHRWQTMKKDLDPTQVAALTEAAVLVENNPELVQRVRSAPESLLSADRIQLSEGKSWLARVWNKKRPDADATLDAALAGAVVDDAALRALAPGAPRSAKALNPAHEELKALVADALSQRD